MDSSTKLITGVIGSVIALAILLLLFPITIIDAGTVGVVVRNGAVNRTLEPGMHGRIPLIESVIDMNVQTQKQEADAGAASKDLQNVSTKVTLNYSLDATHVGEIYQDLRNDYSDRVITPAIQEAVKSATAKYTAEELITKRELVKADILKDLKERLAPRFINVQDVLITSFDFSAQFNTAIESKVRAEQDALASKNKLDQVKYEAQQTIEKAKADAEAIRISAQAINSQGGADYVQLQAITKWDGHLPTQMIPGGTVPFLNLKN